MVQSAAPESSAERFDARRREILLSASRAYRERGFHATGMREIAQAAGMTAGNLYHYFEGKEALLAFCQEESARRLLELAGWVRAQPWRADARLCALIVGHVLVLNEGLPGSLAHLEVESLTGAGRRRVLDLRDAYEQSLRELLREGVEAAVFRPVDLKLGALAILGALNWTVKWFRPGGSATAREVGEHFAEQIVRGVLAPGIEAERPAAEVPIFGGSAGREDRAALAAMKANAAHAATKRSR